MNRHIYRLVAAILMSMAMECFIKSINLGDESNDISTKARNYSAQGSLYSQYYNWEGSAQKGEAHRVCPESVPR